MACLPVRSFNEGGRIAPPRWICIFDEKKLFIELTVSAERIKKDKILFWELSEKSPPVTCDVDAPVTSKPSAQFMIVENRIIRFFHEAFESGIKRVLNCSWSFIVLLSELPTEPYLHRTYSSSLAR